MLVPKRVPFCSCEWEELVSKVSKNELNTLWDPGVVEVFPKRGPFCSCEWEVFCSCEWGGVTRPSQSVTGQSSRVLLFLRTVGRFGVLAAGLSKTNLLLRFLFLLLPFPCHFLFLTFLFSCCSVTLFNGVVLVLFLSPVETPFERESSSPCLAAASSDL